VVRRGLAVVVAGVLAAACGGSSAEPTPEEVLAEGGSVAEVTIAGAAYEFVVDCYDAGAGSVVVVGEGQEPDSVIANGERGPRDTHVLVQAYLGDSYVGVTVEGADEDEADVVYEASLDDALDLVLEDDVIAAESITFVRDLDLESGSGEPAGEGGLRVACGRYEAGVPPVDGA
jgi:hypothetical protein